MDKCVVLDIDNTILNFDQPLCDKHNMLYGTNITPDDLHKWELPKDLYETFRKHEHEIYKDQPVLPGVRNKMFQLYMGGYKIILMTARDKAFKVITELSLRRNGLPYHEIYFNKNKALKINRLAENRDIVIFADDKAETVNKVIESTTVKRVYLIDQPHNKKEEIKEGIIRISSIEEIYICRS